MINSSAMVDAQIEEFNALSMDSISEKIENKQEEGKITQSKPKPNYPRVSEMVNLAIKALCEKNGSSLQAIKKYMVETYKIDVEKQNPFIKKYLKSAVEAGFLIRTKGRGAAGSFKIPRHEIDPLKVVVKPAPKSRRNKANGTKESLKKSKPSKKNGKKFASIEEIIGEGSAQSKQVKREKNIQRKRKENSK